MAYNFNKILPHRSTWILERALWREGKRYVVGIDEAGRGSIAGPIVAAAVVLPVECRLRGLNDSKSLSEAKRDVLACEIERMCVATAIVEIGNETIDADGIGTVNGRLFRNALKKITAVLRNNNSKPNFAVIDGRRLVDLPIEHEYVIDGDARVKSIAAASILAKVYRDKRMIHYGSQYPEYGFSEHKGYGTARHWTAIDRLGACPIHRQSFLLKYQLRKNKGSLV